MRIDWVGVIIKTHLFLFWDDHPHCILEGIGVALRFVSPTKVSISNDSAGEINEWNEEREGAIEFASRIDPDAEHLLNIACDIQRERKSNHEQHHDI